MGSIMDVFSAEDRVPVKFSDFYSLIKEAAEKEVILNGVNCNVPHEYIREMVTGKQEEHALAVTAEITVEIPPEELEETVRRVCKELKIPPEVLGGKDIPEAWPEPEPEPEAVTDPNENEQKGE